MYIIYLRKEDNKYVVIKEGNKKASKVFDSREEAVYYCQKKKYEYRFSTDNSLITTNNKSHHKFYKIILTVIALLLVCLIALVLLDYYGVVKTNIYIYFNDFITNVTKPKEDEKSNNSNPTDNTNTPPNDSDNDDQTDNTTTTPSDTIKGITYDDFQIHFLELGNEYTGDSVYIKAGDTDILIDAGSRKDSASFISDYLDEYVTDDTLEYVIATHGDQDHISGFVGNKSGSSYTGILYNYDVDNIIMNNLTTKTSQTYKDFLKAVDYAKGNGANVMYAADCFNDTNGAQSSFVLDSTNNITMDILYNYYYFYESSDENNYSVCVMLNYNDHHFMLTGDLELEGEEEMAKYYDGSTPDKTLPHVDLFKAGHHGSKTSSNECLLKLITPDIVCVCCCAGSSEYTANYENQFPTQDFIDRVAKYTDEVYVTSYYDEYDGKTKSLNGTIIVSSNGTEVAVSATDNTTKLKDTAWFNDTVYVKNGKICDDKGDKNFYTKDTPGVSAVKRRIWPA